MLQNEHVFGGLIALFQAGKLKNLCHKSIASRKILQKLVNYTAIIELLKIYRKMFSNFTVFIEIVT